MHILFCLFRNGFGWISEIYYACQRLGKIVPPVSGDVNSVQRFGLMTNASLPDNVSNELELNLIVMIYFVA